MPRQFVEILDEIMLRQGWRQEDLARFMAVKQPAISRMRFSEDWNMHWQIFLKLLPLCLKHELISVRDLPSLKDYEPESIHSNGAKSKFQDSSERKKAKTHRS